VSFPQHEKYKDSGVGWIGDIPQHWDCLPGKRLFSQRREAALPEDEQLSATQKYGVIPQRMFMELEDQKVMLALAGLGNFKHVNKDDFVISLRSFQGGIESCLYDGCVSPAYTVLRPNRAFYPKYWAFVLKSAPYISALQSVTDGTTAHLFTTNSMPSQMTKSPGGDGVISARSTMILSPGESSGSMPSPVT